jgi:peptidoglycan-associated lipoprotein
MKHLAIILTFAALLVGCADQPPKDAVIEDRGIRAATKVEEGKPLETQGMIVAPVDSKSIPSGAGAAVGTGVAPGAGAAAGVGKPVADVPPKPAPQKVETHALAEPATEVKPLVASEVGPAAAAEVGAGAGAGAGGGEQPAVSLSLKDPNSPLSKRVILFDFDSSAIRDEYRALLEAHAEYLKSNPASKVILQGHADERGSREYNLALGQRRSESVFKAMTLLGVSDPQMEAVSMGEEKPVAEGHDEESWQQNRRTEIVYQGE